MNNFFELESYKNAFNKNNKQIDFYIKNNANEKILKFFELGSKSFGSLIEKIIIENYEFDKRINTEHDVIFNGIKIEIKSARYWNHQYDCKWQHIEIDYDYDILLFVLLDFQDIKMWCISKQKLFNSDNLENKLIIKQGKQGYWVNKSKIMNQLYSIESKNDLIKYLEKNKKDD